MVVTSDQLQAATAVVDALGDRGLTGRLLGGTAVALRCPSMVEHPALYRAYSDIDLIIEDQARSEVDLALEACGYEPHTRFNAAHGHLRRLYYKPNAEDHVDVFVGVFRMCHNLDVRQRLAIDQRTLSLADLFLTKAQIASLNHKDLTDLTALLLDYDLTDGEDGIAQPYVVARLTTDWGWWKTVTDNIQVLLGRLDTLRLEGEAHAIVRYRANALLESIDSASKSRRWRARARIGTRLSWREEPEERV